MGKSTSLKKTWPPSIHYPWSFSSKLTKKNHPSPKRKKHLRFQAQPFFKTNIGHTNYLYPYHPWDWYIYLYLLDIHGKCREIYQSHGSYGSGKTRWECVAVEGPSHLKKPFKSLAHTPWKVNGWSLQITPEKKWKMIWTKPPWWWNPCRENLQGRMRGLRLRLDQGFFVT